MVIEYMPLVTSYNDSKIMQDSEWVWVRYYTVIYSPGANKKKLMSE